MITEPDIQFLRQAIDLARSAESLGNLPIGAVISVDGRLIASGQNAIWVPAFNANRHAEIEALRSVPPELWAQAGRMTLYTTLEPCLMCLGAILLHSIGRVVYGAADDYGGAGMVIGHMPPYFEAALANIEWDGPALSAECDPLARRATHLAKLRDKPF